MYISDHVSEMKSVSSLEISISTEPFFGKTETLILMNLIIGSFGYCIFIQKVLEDLNIFDFLKFLYQQDRFSIGFRPKLKKGYRMLIRDQFPPTKTFRRPCNAAMLYSLSADKEMANIPELLREGFFARYTKSSATTQCSVV